MKVCFETFGCRLNRAEALDQEAAYLAKGWELTEKHADADLIVVRGCSVTARAESDCRKLIAHLQRKYPMKRLEVVGCLRKDASSTVSRQPRPRGAVPAAATAPAAVPDAIPVRTARAYLKVQDGCDCKCSFCIVPQFRGKARSVDFDSVLDRAKRFIDAGYREIVVTGCNLALYGSGGRRLAELADSLASLDSGCRIRIGSVEPGPAAMDLVAAMASRGNLCRFLHVPVQSGCNRLLLAMKRPYLVKTVEDLVSVAVKLMPTIGLGCDLMTGFPGEQETDFIMTRGFLKRLPFSNVHVFPYSERPGTMAVAYPDPVPTDLRKRRARELARIGAQKRETWVRKFVGAEVEMLVEDADEATGWTGEYFGCRVTDHREHGGLKRKDLVRVRVTDVKGDVLQGAIADAAF